MSSNRGFTVFDVETTGISAKHGHRIIEIGIVRLDEDFEVIEEWETLLNPNRDIGAYDVHGIESRDLLDAPSFEDVAADIWHRFEGAVPVSHNLAFDRVFLLEELRRIGITLDHFEGLCTMILYAQSATKDKSRKLQQVCSNMGIGFGDLHSAGSDAKLCAEIFLKLCTSSSIELASLPGVSCDDLWTRAATPKGITRKKVRERIVESPLNIVASRISAREVSGDVNPAALDEYLMVLDRAIEDRNITAVEADQLSLLAIDLGLTKDHLSKVHENYIRCLVRNVLSDGRVTPDERSDLHRVGQLLGLNKSQIDDLLTSAPNLGELPKEDLSGKSVCFTGDSRCSVDTIRLDRDEAERLAIHAGMEPKRSVTKKLDILVVADPDTQSGKAKKARDYGVRIISERAFWHKLGVDVE